MTGHFSRLPAAAVSDRRMSAATLRCLAALAVYADKDGRCFPSLKKLGTRLGVSRQAVQHHFRKLKALGYVITESQKRANGSQKVNAYQLVYHTPPQALGLAPLQALGLAPLPAHATSKMFTKKRVMKAENKNGQNFVAFNGPYDG